MSKLKFIWFVGFEIIGPFKFNIAIVFFEFSGPLRYEKYWLLLFLIIKLEIKPAITNIANIAEKKPKTFKNELKNIDIETLILNRNRKYLDITSNI